MATTPTDRRDADERKRKRAAIVKFSLAGAAVLGIGAAATSALWTDDAWFAAEASAVDPSTAIDLQGAYVGTTATPQDSDFATADDEPGTGTDFVTIPAEVFADLTAGDSITVPVWIKNMGTSDLVIATPTVTTDGELFAAGGATATLGAAPTSLAAGSAAVSVDLTIALAADAAESFGGTPGAVVIGSDQVASFDGRVIGKPGSRAAAIAQLQAMSGREVSFLTAVAVAGTGSAGLQALDTTVVRFRPLDEGTIARYVDAEQPFDCAGSFRCEGLGIALFDAIDTRDPTALVGLPLIATARLLREVGFVLP